jgi:hypothetical protein
VPEQLFGQTVKCPHCDTHFAVALDVVPVQPAAVEYRENGRRRPRVPDSLPGNTRAVMAVVMLTVSILTAVAGLATGGLQLSVISRQNLQQPAEEERAELIDTLYGLTGVASFLAYVGTVVAFCLWIYRAHKNLSLLHVRGLQYTDGWAVGAFFVPFLNLVRPYQIVQEMWRASHPMRIDTPTTWQDIKGSALVGTWWGGWLLMNFVSNIATQLMLFPEDGHNKEFVGTALMLVADGIAIIAALLAILVIRGIWARQDARLHELQQAEDALEDT